MTRVYLLRHAKAAAAIPGMKDFDRPLDKSGRDMAALLGANLVAHGLVPDHVIASPSARTRETLQEVGRYFPDGVTTAFDRTLYDGNWDAYLAAIQGVTNDKSVMIIGHNPMTEETTHRLCAPDSLDSRSPLNLGFPTGALAILDFDTNLSQVKPQTARLAHFIVGGQP